MTFPRQSQQIRTLLSLIDISVSEELPGYLLTQFNKNDLLNYTIYIIHCKIKNKHFVHTHIRVYCIVRQNHIAQRLGPYKLCDNYLLLMVIQLN